MTRTKICSPWTWEREDGPAIGAAELVSVGKLGGRAGVESMVMNRLFPNRLRWNYVAALFGAALVVWPWPAHSENRLAGEKSPYLLLHKDNPVAWYPWGAEAFARAKRENKPVFVSIGYSACHWCHVMARESFEDRETAELLNENFINVKVDREERPDVDRLCMMFVQATTGAGGWPMNVWMTPEGAPFLGGTYFPPEDRPGRPGFRTVIRQVAEGWRSDEAEIRAHGGKVRRRSGGARCPSRPKQRRGWCDLPTRLWCATTIPPGAVSERTRSSRARAR